MMDTKRITKSIENEFEFLTSKYMFSLKSRRKQNIRTVLQYRKFNIGIDIEIEFQNFALYILIVQLKKGKEPDGYYVDSNGIQVRKHLHEALKEKGKDVNNYLSLIRRYYEGLINAETDKELDYFLKLLIRFQSEFVQENINYILSSIDDKLE